MSEGAVVTCVARESRLDARPRDERPTVVFTHVPKAAGTTLDRIMHAVAKSQGRVWRRALGTLYGQFLGADKGDALASLDEMSGAALAGVDYLTGHLPYGVHERTSRPCFYVTLLREPVQRLISHFRFGLQREGWSMNADLDELIEAGRLIDNAETRQIAGLVDRSVPCTEAVFETALDHLRRRYGVVGVAERFDETLKALIALLDWPDIAYTDLQVSRVPIAPKIEARVAEAARRRSHWDAALYAYAAGLSVPWSERLVVPAPPPAKAEGVLLVSGRIGVEGHESAVVPRCALEAELARRGVTLRQI